MTRWKNHLKTFALLALLGVLGCSETKLKDKITETLPPGGGKDYVIPSAKSERKVSAEVSASEPVRAVIQKVGNETPIVEQKEPSKSFTLECTQPANQELNFSVTAGAKKTEVTINLLSK